MLAMIFFRCDTESTSNKGKINKWNYIKLKAFAQQKKQSGDFPGGAVVKNLPANIHRKIDKMKRQRAMYLPDEGTR